MARVELVRPVLDPPGLQALSTEWRCLEARAGGSAFQGWGWVGCLARERFPRPVLLRATDGGRTVGLALFNERRRLGAPTLWLGETGNPALDRIFVEHNGVLAEQAYAGELAAWLRAAMRDPVGQGRREKRRLMLSGVGAAGLAAARAAGIVRVRTQRPSPFVDLRGLGPTGDGFLDRLSRNTRQQVRRSDRLYGRIEVRRAATAEEAEAFLDALLGLLERRLANKGRESGLGHPAARRFVRELATAGTLAGEVDLLHIAAGGATIGYLLNLRRGGWVSQYQGGFDYGGASAHQKPGLSAHHAAIRYYCARGEAKYDFLAGVDRYKHSLASGETALHWIETAPKMSLHGVVMKLRDRSVS